MVKAFKKRKEREAQQALAGNSVSLESWEYVLCCVFVVYVFAFVLLLFLLRPPPPARAVASRPPRPSHLPDGDLTSGRPQRSSASPHRQPSARAGAPTAAAATTAAVGLINLFGRAQAMASPKSCRWCACVFGVGWCMLPAAGGLLNTRCGGHVLPHFWGAVFLL